MQRVLNTVLNALRWPILIVLLGLSPVVLLCLIGSVCTVLMRPRDLAMLAVGVGLSAWLARGSTGSTANWLFVLEHEVTHAIFAIATGHRVTHLSAGAQGGELQCVGPGNWLLSLSPYFFPTFCVPVLLVMQVSRPEWMPLWLVLFGIALHGHLRGTLREMHMQQPDLQRYGRRFSVALIVAATPAIACAMLWCVPVFRPIVEWRWGQSTTLVLQAAALVR